jgi:hypothetical protein
MNHPIAPNIRKWYQDIDRNEIFKVIDENAADDSVEIQYFSGELAELDFDTWFSLHLRVVPPPEDSSGPFELSQEEMGYGSENNTPKNGLDPLAGFDLYEDHSSYDNYNLYEIYFDKKDFFRNND